VFELVYHDDLQSGKPMFLTCIWEVNGSNLDRDTSYPDIFNDFPQLLHSRAGIVADVRPRQISYASFPIHYSRIIQILFVI
jgi:hypothetical protein